MQGGNLLGEWLNGQWIPCTDPGCGDGSNGSLQGSTGNPAGLSANNFGPSGPSGSPPQNPAKQAPVTPTTKPQSPITCNSALPNGQTVGQVVSQVDASLDSTESAAAAAGEPPLLSAAGDYVGDALPNGPIDFKNNFKGQGDSGYLSQAGNFAFGSVSAYLFGSGPFGQYVALSGAGVYAYAAGKAGPGIPFIKPPYGADPSAQANVPAGVSAACH